MNHRPTTDVLASPGHAAAVSPAGRAWAFTGAAAGLLGLAGIQASLRVDAVYNDRYAGDAERIRERLGDFVPDLLVMHTATMLATVLMVVFAAGLRRRLRTHAPVGSLLPEVSAAGLWLVSVAGLLGAGFTTEAVFGLQETETRLDPEFAAVFGHWVATIPWLWVGAGVAGVAVAVASLRHGAAPRWLGWAAAVLGGLTLVAGLSPLQYLAGYTGPIAVTVIASGFALGDRDTRRLAG